MKGYRALVSKKAAKELLAPFDAAAECERLAKLRFDSATAEEKDQALEAYLKAADERTCQAYRLIGRLEFYAGR